LHNRIEELSQRLKISRQKRKLRQPKGLFNPFTDNKNARTATQLTILVAAF